MKSHARFLTAGMVFVSTLIPSVCTQNFDSTPTKSFEELLEGDFAQEDRDFTTSGSHLVPPPWPSRWIALGDSFAAGPGAGDPFKDDKSDCQRGRNAYPYQMQGARRMPGPAPNKKAKLGMKACTGDKTRHMLDEQNPNYQLGAINSSVDFVTLSIGGNDVSFSGILKACVFSIPFSGNCDDALKKSRDVLYSKDFHDRYQKVLETILEKMDWTRFPRTAIFVTGYSQFFDTHTNQCNDASFRLDGPKITRDLRKKLNTLTHEVNFVLQYWIDLFNYKYSADQTGEDDIIPVSYVNVDQFYNNHRFCREGVQEPDKKNRDTLFFHMGGDDPQSNTADQREFEDLSEEEVAETIDKYYGLESDEPGAQNLPIWAIKAFHPTSRGFKLISNLVLSRLRFKRLARRLARNGEHFDVAVVGDVIPYASQDPNSDLFQGLIPHLKAIFNDPEFYGWPLISSKLRPNFIGVREPNSGYPEYHSTWEHDTIDELIEHVKDQENLAKKKKIVLLMAGANDLLLNHELDTIKDRVKNLIDRLKEHNQRDTTILLSQLPLYGFKEDGSGTKWDIMQQRFVDYNAMLAELANEYETRGWGKVFLVHSTITPLEHQGSSPILPSAAGYRRMAYDFAQAIVMTGARRWWKGRDTDEFEENSKRSPAPQSNEEERGKVQCYTRDDFSEQPSKEALRESILQHMDIDEYIEKIGCNRTEICKVSDDGLHGDERWPVMVSREATKCARQGGKIGIPDHSILRIEMPSGDYDLEGPTCGDMIKKIMNECIMNNDVAGEVTNEDGLYVGFKPRSAGVDLTEPLFEADKE